MGDDAYLVAADAGVVPQRTDDPARARGLVETDGAAILTGVAPTARGAVAAGHAVWGDRLLAMPEAAEVRSGGIMDNLAARRPPEQALTAHTDGFAYGDDYPDHFLLLCAQASDDGGESFLVDAYRVLDVLAGTPAGAALVEQMETVLLDQTEEGMRRSRAPLLRRGPTGRRMVRRFPEQRPDASSADPIADAGLVAAWDGLCRLAAAGAPRFKLAPGEVVIVDNYRVLHGREPYGDAARLMWRVWMWTDTAHGVPEGVLASDSRNAQQLA